MMCCADNLDPEKDPSSRAGKEGKEASEAAKDFGENYQDMREANTIGADKYFHCKANCEAAARGPTGEDTAENISNLREQTDQAIKGDPPEASAADQEANQTGREAGREVQGSGQDAEPICRAACDEYRPEALDEKY
jgi:hypothetical protein